jgi:CRISPR-associated endonuclease/helicase Cas3
MASPPYAHTLPERPREEWEPLFTPFGDGADLCQRESCQKCQRLEPDHGHLNKVAYWTAKFASEMFAPDSPERQSAHEWGYLAGLWHDLGKFPEKWQTYLKKKSSDAHKDEICGTEDHTTAGAYHAKDQISLVGHLLAYAISGHHSGLLNGSAATTEEASLANRYRKAASKKIFDYTDSAPREILKASAGLNLFPELLRDAAERKDPIRFASFTRMIFSCLVDADFIATESFMSPRSATARPQWRNDILKMMSEALDVHLADFSPDSEVKAYRASILNACLEAADRSTGVSTLTVPTGGGKTLSSLAFALRHALKHGLDRIIFVIPFTSIIEQNAEVFRNVFRSLEASLGLPVVLEHHSNLDSAHESETSRLASENWDAPLVVTTNVQFFESFHANRTSRSRKLHRCARSVIIFDEAQTLPPHLLKPCLSVIKELTGSYGASVVLCTATQPALNKRDDFEIGIETAPETEIIPESLKQEIFDFFSKRIALRNLGKQTDEQLVDFLDQEPRSLCVVNTTGHARKLFSDFLKTHPNSDGLFHLSARMLPSHRSALLGDSTNPAAGTIRYRLSHNLPCRVISTQLIEAGVDIDFPVVIRSLAGMDSIAQAFGRCNRSGLLPNPGQALIFESEHEKWNSWLSSATSHSREILNIYPGDPIGLSAIEHFFRLFIWQQGNRAGAYDKPGITEMFTLQPRDPAFPFNFLFKDAAEAFAMIDSAQTGVFIPRGDEGKRLEGLIRVGGPWERADWRSLQRHTVSIRQREFDAQIGRTIESENERGIPILTCPDLHYSENFGLTFEDDGSYLGI